MKQIVVNVEPNQTRVAVQEDGRLAELYVESGTGEDIVGNIYRARVVNVIPSMQAAFVDIGQEKNAFLYIDEALPASYKQTAKGQEKPSIRELVQVGEERLVQVSKEGFGTKAPRVTTQISLPGRILVYMPTDPHVTVSRKIENPKERSRLVEITKGLLQGEEGAIIRTQAEGVDEARIAAELAYLRSRWQKALEMSKGQKLPVLIHQDADIVTRVIRDTFNEQVSELVIDSQPVLQQVRQTVEALYPKLVSRVRFYQGKPPIFDAYEVEREIDKALRRQVPLPSGGSLIFDQTEALTVIDVNTGKFTGKGGTQLEETVTDANLEAASEIARQLRLRDIGGIILIDFIDMRSVVNKERVILKLKEELAHDKTTTFVLGMTQLGLVEMTRKKMRQNLTDSLTRTCPTCQGKGKILSQTEVLSRLEREIRALAKNGDVEQVALELHPEMAQGMQADGHQQRIEKDFHITLTIREQSTMSPDDYRIAYAGTAR
ncbi:Rne/Rng family ribonuclease [Brevibacillus dissolubilis]|uniref:Rne/Rng family ribonuclease n=1 Tax=Brevibacillus dissolubilis TaxID=1844116 RepID=UPI00159BA37D|nr:Rne/Rng family ribonuclease [Brevibacillus dissolubilis]